MLHNITMFYAGVLALLLLAMSFRLVSLRRRLRVGLGSGGDEALERQMRAHGNFCEYVPIALILLLLLEASTVASVWLLHGLGIVLVVARILHGFFGLNRQSGTSFGRFWGTALSWLVIALTGLYLVAISLGRWLSAGI